MGKAPSRTFLFSFFFLMLGGFFCLEGVGRGTVREKQEKPKEGGAAVLCWVKAGTWNMLEPTELEMGAVHRFGGAKTAGERLNPTI